MKAIEKVKNVYGEKAALLSLVDALNNLKTRSYKNIFKKIGYIKE